MPDTKPNWIDSPSCRQRFACRVCRLRVLGRPFRAGLAAQYTLPAGGADFPCPQGVPWDVSSIANRESQIPAGLTQDPGKAGCNCAPPAGL
jgi:hypothetical protein